MSSGFIDFSRNLATHLFLDFSYIFFSRRHIVNALPFIGSNAALNVMRDLMIKRYVDQTTIDNWIIAFAFIPQPDRNTINILSPLLELRQLSETQFILSYSATIYAFCSNQGVQRCVNVEQVTRFLSHLEQKIEKGCAPRTHSFSAIKEVRFESK